MRCLRRSASTLLLAIAFIQPAFAADVRLSQAADVRPDHAGVVTENGLDGFALVTFGVWQPSKDTEPSPKRTGETAASRYQSPSRRFSSSFRRAVYHAQVEAEEQRYALPQGLLDALIWTESRYNPLALSRTGAAGLGQLMPQTARDLGVFNRYDPRANIQGAAKYLRQMLDRFNAIHLAVAAYNAGPRAVEKASGVPLNDETPRYVRNVLSNWRERGK
jgi:soluble lytic murein transglycosylase-like protein